MRAFIEKIQRMFYWGWKMRNSVDFDACAIYEMLYLKLDRVYNCFLVNSHCVWNSDPNSKGMRRLRIARELARRLSTDLYIDNYEKHLEKFPKEDDWLEFRMEDNERKSFLRAVKKDDYLVERDKEYLFELLNRNINFWWD